ncbi:hypothetical protein ACOMHN_051051 [Nucella lapillus]
MWCGAVWCGVRRGSRSIRRVASGACCRLTINSGRSSADVALPTLVARGWCPGAHSARPPGISARQRPPHSLPLLIVTQADPVENGLSVKRGHNEQAMGYGHTPCRAGAAHSVSGAGPTWLAVWAAPGMVP